MRTGNYIRKRTGYVFTKRLIARPKKKKKSILVIEGWADFAKPITPSSCAQNK